MGETRTRGIKENHEVGDLQGSRVRVETEVT